MERIIRSRHVQVSIARKGEQAASNLWTEAEYGRYAIIPMLLMIIGCMGGIGAAFGAKDDILKLALIAFPTILALAFILAVAPMRLIVWACSIAVILDIITLFI